MSEIAELAAARDSAASIAIEALACAMAERLNPYNTAPPSAELIERATLIVNATLDRAGRPFVVLMYGDIEDAKRLAEANGKDSEQFFNEALCVIERLTHPSVIVSPSVDS